MCKRQTSGWRRDLIVGLIVAALLILGFFVAGPDDALCSYNNAPSGFDHCP